MILATCRTIGISKQRGFWLRYFLENSYPESKTHAT
jgi:hypothetical protein